MTLLGSAKIKVAKDGKGENMLHLETADIVLVHFDIFNYNCQHIYRLLYTFVPNKPFGQLLDISPKNIYKIQSFHTLKYGLRITIPNCFR